MLIRLILLAVILLTACTPFSISTPDLTQTTSPLPVTTKPTSLPIIRESPPVTPFPSTPSASDLQDLIEKTKEDLAQRLAISIAQINVIDAKDVIWPNSALGCPQSGMMYAEVLTPGYLILLHAEGQDYEYHAGKNSDPFLCENPTPPVPGMAGDT